MNDKLYIYTFGGGDLSMWKYSRFVVRTTDPRLMGQEEPYRDFWFSNAEQYVMAMKALLFDNLGIFWQVMDTRSPSEADTIAADGNFANFDEERWHQHLMQFVYDANMQKFSQDDKLRESLMKAPHDAFFAFTTDKDLLLGTGLPCRDKSNRVPSKWPGVNILGLALTAVRDELLRQQPHDEEQQEEE